MILLGMVGDNWNNDQGLVESLSNIIPVLKEWNVYTFENIYYRKKQLLARLNGIHRAMGNAASVNLFLVNLEKELTSIYQLGLHQESCVSKNQESNGFSWEIKIQLFFILLLLCGEVIKEWKL